MAQYTEEFLAAARHGYENTDQPMRDLARELGIGITTLSTLAEVNQGGDMVGAVLRTVDATVPLKTVHARRGKFLRAEPVAALYAQGKVKHAGRPMPELEDQMCDFGLDGLSSGGSPDRLDALVWAVTELTGRGWQGPRIRAL